MHRLTSFFPLCPPPNQQSFITKIVLLNFVFMFYASQIMPVKMLPLKFSFLIIPFSFNCLAVLYILTSFWVHAAPKSWSKYITQLPVQPGTILFYSSLAYQDDQSCIHSWLLGHVVHQIVPKMKNMFFFTQIWGQFNTVCESTT